ncbi:MAG TPA: aminotransferase class V-fold PLP-dependent enzyme [Planctomycetaceae bacterium]|jgi:selenocysteine lyase/cysteine desulfurase|nr:aminotransferase class V-fold PLP-dependent enzyme [Planctomycetaceae bacterium]
MNAAQNWWDDFRGKMPVVEKWAYFDHAGVAPLPGPTAEVLIDFARDNAANGVANWTRWRTTVETARQLGAKLIGSETDEIAVIHNTTEGINFIAEGFPWQPGDNVVTLSSEFPSNLYPWLNLASRGVETRRVAAAENERVDPADIERACDARTRVLAVSWVGYKTGWRNDLAALAEICTRRKIFFFVDAIQGLGVFPLDVGKIPIDALAADGHKWLLSPEGAGLLYVRQSRLDMLRAIGVGWNSVRHSGDFTNTRFDLKTDASRYEGGSHCLAAIAGLAKSLEILVGIGPERISAQLLKMTDQLCERLARAKLPVASCREGDRRSGIVSFEVPGKDPLQLKKDCRAHGVIVNARAGRMRAAPHAYVNERDLDRLLEAVTA